MTSTGTELAAVNNPNEKWSVAHTDKIQPFIPDGFASVYKFAELIAHSGMAPKDMKSADQIAVAIFHGLEIGMTPLAALQSIAVINGRPSIWGDGALALVRASGKLEDFDETFEGGDLYLEPPEFNDIGTITKAGKPNPNYKAICTVKRRDGKVKAYEFSAMDAMLAGLYNKDGPWRQYKKRMLQMRARGFALRDQFTDVMRGLVLAEEAQDYDMDLQAGAGREPREDIPAEPAETTAAAKPRKAREKNKYQADDGAAAKVEEAEVLSETKGKTIAEVVDTATGEITTKVEDEEEPKEPARKAEPAPAKQAAAPAADDRKAKATAALNQLLEEIGPDKQLKDHIAYINELLLPLNTIDEMKVAWDKRTTMKGMVVSQGVFEKRMRDHHKQRVFDSMEGEDVPSEPKAKPAVVFDYPAFIDSLDKLLEQETKPEDVNTVFQQVTQPAMHDGAITTEQLENDLKPLLAQHLERTDFGS